MNNYLKIYFIIILIFASSCKKETRSNKYILENDTLKYKLSYYASGEIKTKDSYKVINGDTLIEGNCFEFYPNGNLKTKSFIKNNEVDGYIFNYYKNGQVRKEAFIKDKKPIGVWRTYYKNGLIETYACSDIYGKIRFFKIYDSINKKIIRENGEHVIQHYQNNDSLTLGDTLKLNLFVATPPKTNLNFKVIYNYGDDSLRSIEKKYEIIDNRVKIDTVFNKKGSYKINFELEVIDSIKNTVNKETHSSKLYIY